MPSAGPPSGLPCQTTSPEVGGNRPATMRSRVDLPEPEPTEQPDDLAAADRQIYAFQHHEVGAAVLVIGLPAVDDLEDGSRR